MQLADHDALFGPKRRRISWGRMFFWLPFLPAIALFFMPSFKLGTTFFKDPSFEIPTRLEPQAIFTLPATEELLFPQVDGRTLSLIEKPEPMYIGVTDSEKSADLSFSFNKEDRRLSPKMFLPRFDHPSAAVFVKRIPVEKSKETESDDPAASNERVQASSLAAPREMSEKEAEIYSRTDGFSQLACWTEPQLAPYVDPKPMTIQIARSNAPKLASITVAGPGTVVHTGATGVSEKTVIVYHGGGLFSRYFGLKDYKVRKNDKVKAGQVIALLSAGTKREPASVRWDIRMGDRVINPESLMALSSQLCGSK